MPQTNRRKPKRNSSASSPPEVVPAASDLRLTVKPKRLRGQSTFSISRPGKKRLPDWVEEMCHNMPAQVRKVIGPFASAELKLTGDLEAAQRMPVELQRWVTEILHSIVTNDLESLPQPARNLYLRVSYSVELTDALKDDKRTLMRSLEQLAAKVVKAGQKLIEVDADQQSGRTKKKLVDTAYRNAGALVREVERLGQALVPEAQFEMIRDWPTASLPPRSLLADSADLPRDVATAKGFVNYVEQQAQLGRVASKKNKMEPVPVLLTQETAQYLLDQLALSWPHVRKQVLDSSVKFRRKFRTALNVALDRAVLAWKCPVCAKGAKLSYWSIRDQFRLVHPNKVEHHNHRELPTTIEFVAAPLDRRTVRLVLGG